MDESVRGGMIRLHTQFKETFETVGDAIKYLKPAKPLYVIYPDVIAKTANRFVKAFPGKAMYAVKTNADYTVVDAVAAGGVQAFDVASLEEVKQIKAQCYDAEIYFMHPVKSPEDIRSAYFDYGVRNFVLDCKDELFKIMRETDLAQDLNLFVRIALPKNDTAMIDFSSKFGANRNDAIVLLRECRNVAQTLGVSFHVGTQTTDAEKYARAIHYTAEILEASGVKIDALNVGGGFPVPYADGQSVCSLEDCVEEIQGALNETGLDHLPLLSEPGRYLVAQGAKLVARVELRKGDTLYINDGIYGGLFDACAWLGLKYPVNAISCDRPFDGDIGQFRLAGPTCDSLDMMDGPFLLPSDIGLGDWIIFDNCGAYSAAMRSNFNGFGYADTVCVQTEY